MLAADPVSQPAGDRKDVQDHVDLGLSARYSDGPGDRGHRAGPDSFRAAGSRCSRTRCPG
jgi:hypothetical protein